MKAIIKEYVSQAAAETVNEVFDLGDGQTMLCLDYESSDAFRGELAKAGYSAVKQFSVGSTDGTFFARENGGTGPFASEVRSNRMVEVGDIIQLSNAEGMFYHTLIISEILPNEVLVCAHSVDSLDRPLSTYEYTGLRVLHVEGVRLSYTGGAGFYDLLEGVALPQTPDI